MMRSLHQARRRGVRASIAATAAVAALATAAGCSSSGGGTSAAATPGKVTLQFWGSSNGLQAAAAAWNKANPNIQVVFTKDTTDAAGFEKLSAAAKAGNAPCLAQFDAQDLVTFASQGLVQDVTKYASGYQSKFTTASWQAASPGGATYGLPISSAPNFYAYRVSQFQKYGLKVPATWDDLIADGQKLQQQNASMKIWNAAPEDPSTFVGLNWDAGATWYKSTGNGWIIDFTSPAALKAANVLQQLVNDHLLSTVSYTDPGIWKTWDDGTTISMGTSTWQLPIYSSVFPKTDGDWAITTIPQYEAGDASTDSNYTIAGVLKGCQYPQQAAEFGYWLGTDATALKITMDPTAGAGYFPPLNDVSSYVNGVIPAKMVPQSDSASVVLKAASEVNNAWQYGPDYATMYVKMQTYWPQVLSGQMTAVQLLQTMQSFVMNDLKSQGINATAGS
jgi:multiple sugar transport system substrate-binding protein